MKSYLLILSTFLTIFPAFLLGTNPDNDLVVLRPIPIRPPSRLTVLTRFTLEETGLTQEESAAIELRDILTGRTNHSITSPRTNNSMTPTRTTTPINLGQPDKEKQNCLQKLAKKNNIQLSQKPLKPKPNSSNNKFCQSNQQSTHNSQRQYSLPEPQQRHQNYLQNNQTSLVSQDIQNIQYNPNNPNPYQQRQQWPQNPPNPYNNQFNHSNQINHRLIQNSQNYSQPNQTNYNPNNYQQPQQRYQNYPPNNQTSLRSQDRQNIQYNPNNQNPDQQRQQWSQNPSNPYNNNQFNHSNQRLIQNFQNYSQPKHTNCNPNNYQQPQQLSQNSSSQCRNQNYAINKKPQIYQQRSKKFRTGSNNTTQLPLSNHSTNKGNKLNQANYEAYCRKQKMRSLAQKECNSSVQSSYRKNN